MENGTFGKAPFENALFGNRNLDSVVSGRSGPHAPCGALLEENLVHTPRLTTTYSPEATVIPVLDILIWR